VAKIIANRLSKYGIDKEFIRPEGYGFRNREDCISLLHFIKNYMSETEI